MTLKSMSAKKTLSSRPLWSCLMRLRKLHRAHSLTKSSLFRFNTTFQSTSPYAGDDPFVDFGAKPKKNFNPRPPTRGTTHICKKSKRVLYISIHVPLRGGRLLFAVILREISKFQSTSPYAGDDNGRKRQPH